MLEHTAPGHARLIGRLDMHSIAQMVQPLVALARQEDLELDLSAISEADSAAVALLLQAKRASLASGHRLTLTGWPASLLTLAQLYALDDVLTAPIGT